MAVRIDPIEEREDKYLENVKSSALALKFTGVFLPILLTLALLSGVAIALPQTKPQVFNIPQKLEKHIGIFNNFGLEDYASLQGNLVTPIAGISGGDELLIPIPNVSLWNVAVSKSQYVSIDYSFPIVDNRTVRVAGNFPHVTTELNKPHETATLSITTKGTPSPKAFYDFLSILSRTSRADNCDPTLGNQNVSESYSNKTKTLRLSAVAGKPCVAVQLEPSTSYTVSFGQYASTGFEICLYNQQGCQVVRSSNRVTSLHQSCFLVQTAATGLSYLFFYAVSANNGISEANFQNVTILKVAIPTIPSTVTETKTNA